MRLLGWLRRLFRTPAPVPPPVPPSDGDRESLAVYYQNDERAKRGLPPLTVDTRLGEAARGHAAWMAASGQLTHTQPGGVDAGERATDAGYDWVAVGENIAVGQVTAAEAVAGWMASPGHRRNILGRSFQDVGVGAVQDSGGRWWWCCVYGGE